MQAAVQMPLRQKFVPVQAAPVPHTQVVPEQVLPLVHEEAVHVHTALANVVPEQIWPAAQAVAPARLLHTHPALATVEQMVKPEHGALATGTALVVHWH